VFGKNILPEEDTDCQLLSPELSGKILTFTDDSGCYGHYKKNIENSDVSMEIPYDPCRIPHLVPYDTYPMERLVVKELFSLKTGHSGYVQPPGIFFLYEYRYREKILCL